MRLASVFPSDDQEKRDTAVVFGFEDHFRPNSGHGLDFDVPRSSLGDSISGKVLDC